MKITIVPSSVLDRTTEAVRALRVKRAQIAAAGYIVGQHAITTNLAPAYFDAMLDWAEPSAYTVEPLIYCGL